jgi:hypothetical protein
MRPSPRMIVSSFPSCCRLHRRDCSFSCWLGECSSSSSHCDVVVSGCLLVSSQSVQAAHQTVGPDPLFLARRHHGDGAHGDGGSERAGGTTRPDSLLVVSRRDSRRRMTPQLLPDRGPRSTARSSRDDDDAIPPACQFERRRRSGPCHDDADAADADAGDDGENPTTQARGSCRERRHAPHSTPDATGGCPGPTVTPPSFLPSSAEGQRKLLPLSLSLSLSDEVVVGQVSTHRGLVVC